MDIFNVLALIGGLCLFLFGMNLMGEALERRAGSKLKTILGKLTNGRIAGFLTGLGVTSIIQSSSATTVMVVGFTNSGLMTLKQAINVIMGANVGTTVTAWLLSLGGIDSSNTFVQLLKPSSFTPVLALIGIALYMFSKKDKAKDTAVILLGFATLMYGMDAMSDSVSGLKDVPAFQQLFIKFQNPILGVLAGAILTGIIQSSSASVGILQALSATGQVTIGASIPIIMGQNIGTCVTALLSSAGTNKNARRTAVVHLSFNVIGSVILLSVYSLMKYTVNPTILNDSANHVTIAVCHSVFNIICTALLLPCAGLLEKLACKIIPDLKTTDNFTTLDDRLLTTPSIAIDQSRSVTVELANFAVEGLHNAIASFENYTPELAEKIRNAEEKTDKYEDILGSYLVRLSSLKISSEDSAETAMLLKVIGDFERISDHSVNLLESVEEMREKEIVLSTNAKNELLTLTAAVNEIVDLAYLAFTERSNDVIASIEPLEQVIDQLKCSLRNNHITRLQQGECTIDAGFVWSDMLTNLERTSDHCSNIAGCMLDLTLHDMNIHENLRAIKRDGEEFNRKFDEYLLKYSI